MLKLAQASSTCFGTLPGDGISPRGEPQGNVGDSHNQVTLRQRFGQTPLGAVFGIVIGSGWRMLILYLGSPWLHSLTK
jgi:hypothetical protein